MAKLSEKHPRESELAHTLLEPFRTHAPLAGLWDGGIEITGERADDLEMKICEALVDWGIETLKDFGNAK